ncbi:MAG: arsenate reductase family protein [Deltaproteobacteria bacterium]|nr:arsenate reductase family protein [Deltaproteobacteria bacterium]
MSQKPVVYQYPRCSTCRSALKWLDQAGIEVETVDLVQTPPSRATLEKAARLAGVPVRKLFNTSGESYRNGNFKEKLETMTDAQAFDALAKDGKLIKRPLVLTSSLALVGFNEEAWADALK